MTNPSTPADDHTSAYLDAMHAKVNEHLGGIIAETTEAIFESSGFPWRDNATQTAIAAHFRALPPGTDLADGIVQVITAIYAEHDFPHDPDAVRQAVTRQLDGGPHGTSGE